MKGITHLQFRMLPCQLVNHVNKFLGLVLLLLFRHLFYGIWPRLLVVASHWIEAVQKQKSPEGCLFLIMLSIKAK